MRGRAVIIMVVIDSDPPDYGLDAEPMDGPPTHWANHTCNGVGLQASKTGPIAHILMDQPPSVLTRLIADTLCDNQASWEPGIYFIFVPPGVRLKVIHTPTSGADAS